MLNDVVLEGLVVKTWRYMEDLLFRVACYRDPDLPAKPNGLLHDAADFVTVRVIKGSLGAPVSVEKGAILRVHGFLQSRDYSETLADFLKDAQGASLDVPEGLDPQDLAAPRTTTEIIARRIMRISQPSRR